MLDKEWCEFVKKCIEEDEIKLGVFIGNVSKNEKKKSSLIRYFYYDAFFIYSLTFIASLFNII